MLRHLTISMLLLMAPLKSSYSCFEKIDNKSIDQRNDSSKISHREFNEIVDAARIMFVEKAASENISLNLTGYWDSPVINAYTLVIGNSASISIYGGIAKATSLTSEGLALALCHELGHVLGGEPYFGDFNNSVEGGADYYSTRHCLKEFLTVLNLPPSDNLTPDISKICSFDKDELLCQQVLVGGLSVMTELSKMSPNGNTELSYYTPDSTISPTTLKSYPSFQCRLDTILRGYLNLSRPSCWFNENDPNNHADSDVITI